jgi:hypothetical protein
MRRNARSRSVKDDRNESQTDICTDSYDVSDGIDAVKDQKRSSG